MDTTTATQHAALSVTTSNYIGLNQPSEMSRFEMLHLCEHVDAYAASLFDFFRTSDSQGVSIICCERVEETGIGAALMDRLRRASES